MVSLILFSMMVTGPALYYASLTTNANTKYGINVTHTQDVATFQVADEVIIKANTLQETTENIATGNIITDFVGILIKGVGVLSIFFDFTGIFTNVANDFTRILGFGGAGGWITAGILGIILVVITAKILSLAMNREV